MTNSIDLATTVREGEELDTDSLRAWFAEQAPELQGGITVEQFPSGHSNLTYLLRINGDEYVLRRPPFGAEKIARGHDMSREWTVLSALDGHFDAIPKPITYCEDTDVIGAPFYVMERVRGVILRGAKPEVSGLDEDTMRGLSEAFVDTLVAIHEIDYESCGLGDVGRPTGYVERQIEGWTKRYRRARTDEIPAMEETAEWLDAKKPSEVGVSVIHNDFKYDNFVLHPDDLTRVEAVLDWEMATVGDPLMDLGTSLAYWVEPGDPEVLHALDFGPTARAGNFSRQQLAERYCERSGLELENIVFYYVYGLFKVAVIGQQIYFRYTEGDTDDPRFAMLIDAVRALSKRAVEAIGRRSISAGSS